jgi:NitT/TauT family transport system ATP-binding protein
MIISNLSKSYTAENSTIEVLNNFNLTVPTKTITALVGPSGCGKTTLLRLVGELEKPDSGTIKKSSEEQGRISYLFQEPRLLPWFSVLTNVELVLRPFYAKNERINKAMSFIEMVELADYARLKPAQLSGGMRQRVAIARAFAYPAQMMLLDEPFQSLDSSLRWLLVRSFVKLWEQEKRTTLYVTHDVQEALLMADQVVKLSHRPMDILALHKIEEEKSNRSLSDPQLIALQTLFYG